MKKLLGILSLLSLAATGWSAPFLPALQRQFFTTNEVAGGIMSNTIAVHGPIGGDRVYTGSTGLTNAFWNVTNYDTIDIGPGTYTFKAFKNVQGDYDIYSGGLQIGRTNDTAGIHDITIKGHSAILVATNYGTMLSMCGVSNVTVSGLTFVGDHSSLTNYTNANWSIEMAIATATNRAGDKVTGVMIDNCKFFDIPDQGISFLYGGAHNSHVRNCYFEHLGAYKAFGGGTAADGSCISGDLQNGTVCNNIATNVTAFLEFDGSHGIPNATSGGLVVNGNVVKGLTGFGVVVNNAAGQAIKDMTITDNIFEFKNAYHFASNDYSSAVNFNGSVSNVVIKGNFIIGNTNALGYFINILDSPDACRDILITENVFRDITPGIGISLSGITGGKGLNNIMIARNSFNRVRVPIYVLGGSDIIIDGNTIQAWPSGLAAITLTGSYGVDRTSNVVMRANTFIPTNTGCYALYVFTNYPSLTFFDNEFRYPGFTTWGSWLVPTTASNLLYRGSGAGAPDFACKAGSVYYRTDTSTAGSIYNMTNSVGVAHASCWVALGAAGSASGAYIPDLNGQGTNTILRGSTIAATPLKIYGRTGQEGDLLTVFDSSSNSLSGFDSDGVLFASNATFTGTVTIPTQNVTQVYATAAIVTNLTIKPAAATFHNGVVIPATTAYGKFITNATFTITGFSGTSTADRNLCSMLYSNSSGSLIYITNSPTTGLFGSGSTNILAVPAAKQAYFSWDLVQGSYTNCANAVQQ